MLCGLLGSLNKDWTGPDPTHEATRELPPTLFLISESAHCFLTLGFKFNYLFTYFLQ